MLVSDSSTVFPPPAFNSDCSGCLHIKLFTVLWVHMCVCLCACVCLCVMSQQSLSAPSLRPDCGAQAAHPAGREAQEGDGHARGVHSGPDTEVLQLVGQGPHWQQDPQ